MEPTCLVLPNAPVVSADWHPHLDIRAGDGCFQFAEIGVYYEHTATITRRATDME